MRRRPLRGSALLAAVASLSLAAVIAVRPGDAEAQAPTSCFGEISRNGVERLAGRRLRFGITPLVQAGQIGGTPAAPVPERRGKTFRALDRLRPRNGPFVVRLNRLFWSDRDAGLDRYRRLARLYSRRGYLVELQLRYHPDARQEGDIPAWARYVRRAVRTFAPNESVVAMQVTNEVNITFSADSSDGAYEGARDALIRGVVAADRATRRLRADHLEIGFNWFYRLDPATEEGFWGAIRDGGRRFRRALDWIGLDAYPQTLFPPVETSPGTSMLNALSTMRCYARSAGIRDEVPLHVEENGWPTLPPVRPYSRQAEILEGAVDTVDDFRGTYNVTDYRWFNLRDGDSSSPQLFQHLGLLEDDYDPKPAFGVYERMVEERSRAG